MNNIVVEILKNGEYVDYSSRAIFSEKTKALLDERLDEGVISLKRIEDEAFLPLTTVKITYVNHPECKLSDNMINNIINNDMQGIDFYAQSSNTLAEYKTKYYFISHDEVSEAPVGSGKYNHEISLIELTKIAEGYIGDSLTFTNPLE